MSGPTPIDWPRLASQCVFELRTPMSVAQGYVTFVLKDPGSMDEKHRAFLQNALTALARFRALLDELNDLAHVERGGVPFSQQDVDVRSLMQEAVASFPVEPDRPLVLMAGGEAATVKADPFRLRRALTGVIDGVRRYSGESQTISFVQNSDDAPGILRICIADSARIDELERADAATLVPFEDTSLGSVSAQRCIELHGGSVWSAPGLTRAAAVVVLQRA